MWMMGYCSDGGDSFSGRKLRTLMPRPSATPTTPLNNIPPYLGRIHAAGSDHLLSFNHHLGTVVTHEQQQQQSSSNNKVRELSGQQQVVVSSRWNPTPEQLQTLEELYKRGTRTPSAEQIQQITAQLRRYGKIEGKNVFYWFQNHKARERQKRRRQLESSSSDDHPPQPHSTFEPTEFRKESPRANNGTGRLEVERTKNWSSTLPLEKNTVSMQRAVKATIPECRAEGGWLHFDDISELQQQQQQRKSLEDHERNNATWQMMEFLGSSNPPTTTLTRISSNNYYNQIKPHNHLNFFLTPPYLDLDQENDDDVDHDGRRRSSNCCHSQSQTLQLFPLQSSCCQEIQAQNEGKEKLEATVEISVTTTPPHKFFEFLPLKN